MTDRFSEEQILDSEFFDDIADELIELVGSTCQTCHVVNDFVYAVASRVIEKSAILDASGDIVLLDTEISEPMLKIAKENLQSNTGACAGPKVIEKDTEALIELIKKTHEPSDATRMIDRVNSFPAISTTCPAIETWSNK